MPTALPTARGADLRAAYEQIFMTNRLNVAFAVDELAVADGMAYAVTRSNGTETVLATGTETKESNREIFIFTRPDDRKISRYMFNKPE